MGSIVPSFIQIIADGVGIPGLSDEAAKVLAPDAEYRVREIVQVLHCPPAPPPFSPCLLTPFCCSEVSEAQQSRCSLSYG